MTQHDTVRFVGPDGALWSVHETSDRPTTGEMMAIGVEPPVSPGPAAAQPPRALLFVSALGFRRVRAFPANWRELSPDELWTLSWKR
jgi:hypothetical protein